MNSLTFTPLNSVIVKQAVALKNEAAYPLAEPQAGGQEQDALQKSAQNLLAHIPGEASGLYLMAVEAIDKPTIPTLTFVFVLALIILVLVRWSAKASSAIMVTSIIAFLIWMLVLDKGLLHALFPKLLPNPLGLILAVFYSTVITMLANAGKIR